MTYALHQMKQFVAQKRAKREKAAYAIQVMSDNKTAKLLNFWRNMRA